MILNSQEIESEMPNKTEMIAGKERLLCYAGGILGSMLANPNCRYNWQHCHEQAIRQAQILIDTVYDDEKLKEILANE